MPEGARTVMIDDAAVRAAKDRARDYLRLKGTEAQADAIHEQVRDAFASLESFLASVSPAVVARRASPREWSVQEIADHLLETHRPGLDELRCLLAGQHPPGDPIPAGLQSRAPMLRPWPWLLRELGQVHADIVALLASVPPEFQTAARAPLVMVVAVKDDAGARVPVEWVEALDWKAYAITWRLHAIDHLKQARAVAAALA
jgi:hypothetical protein